MYDNNEGGRTSLATPQPIQTAASINDGIGNSRIRIQDGTQNIMSQLERLGFYRPMAQQPVNSIEKSIYPEPPRERSFLEMLESQARELKEQANKIEHIAELLNQQF